MAARSMASLTISFGLVAVPVKLYTAHRSTGDAIAFNLLHKACGSRLKQQYLCQKEGVVVERDDMVKGFEFAKDQYVQFTPEEIKALEEAGTHSLDIQQFVPIDAVDPLYFDRTYYLSPDKGGQKPYNLLAEAMTQTQLCAIGRWAAHGKSNLVMLRPVGKVLAMQQLRFAAEVRPATEIEVPDQPVADAELSLAKQLIQTQASSTFDPNAFEDIVRARVQAAIEKKVAEGEEISISEAPSAAGGKVIDLMEALRASLQAVETPKTAAKVEGLGPRKAPRRVERAERKPARKTGSKR